MIYVDETEEFTRQDYERILANIKGEPMSERAIETPRPRAIVVLSGGQDSTLCMYLAMRDGFDVYAITFDYGQRHRREVVSARIVSAMAGVTNHEIVRLGDILHGSSPLVSSNELAQYTDYNSLPGGLEDTFVPMRNQLFLTIAANRAFVLGTSVIYTGVCEEDFGGYPDCRMAFIKAFEMVSRIGTFTNEAATRPFLHVVTPLMHMSKAASVHLALLIDGCYEALAFSHTGYDGAYPPVGRDHATLLRAKGFAEAGVPDPLVLRAWLEGSLPDLPDEPHYSREIATPYLQRIADVLPHASMVQRV